MTGAKPYTVPARAIAILSFSLLFALFFLGIRQAYLSVKDSTSGWLWSSNIGWVQMNNCTTPGQSSSCTGPGYGVSFLPVAPGTGSGYAWSSTLGWITFNNTGCPASVPGCTGGTRIDWAHPNANDTVNVQGWARACSVFQSGCSGPLADDALRGGWDGYIALSSSGSGPTFGVSLNPFIGQFNGFGWGSDIVGWLSFSNAVMPPPPPGILAVNLVANPGEVLSGGSSILTVTAENFATSVTCTIDHGIGAVTMSSSGINAWSGTAKATNITANTTYTATCTGPSGSANDSAQVLVQTDNTGGGGGSGGGGGGGDGGGGGGNNNSTPKKIWYIEI